ncbi:hypothetical protein FB45DRAFT_1059992 [Roridomyces roridus]|uniref:Uncharacterized protein n=1 Tax=Roridomyces roridus TaxID=1738132 RepID=A0AAD7BQI4_9AGAR|nr:hypothetical protein FB45DRAFT_1059992 [Roridomyces roridus]
MLSRQRSTGVVPHRAPSPEEKTTNSYSPLKYSASIVFFVLCYATMSVVAWTATCYLSFKPIGLHRYTVSTADQSVEYGSWFPSTELYLRSEEWFRAARVLAAVVATLTIPVKTAVCTRAAVAFHQCRRLTLRQTMTLANRAWVEPVMWAKLLGASIFGRATFSSSFLVVAIVLNLLGSIIAPLQQLYLSTKTIKTPTWPSPIAGANFDFAVDTLGAYFVNGDMGETTALLRARLSSTLPSTPQAQLWSRNPWCSDTTMSPAASPLACIISGGQYSLDYLSTLADPRTTTTTLITTKSTDPALNATLNLNDGAGQGPLLQTVLALFGVDSFIDVRVQALQSNSFGMDANSALALYNYSQCMGGIVPFIPLTFTPGEQIDNPISGCALPLHPNLADTAQLQIIYYLSSFVPVPGFYPEGAIADAFSAAAFLANQAIFNGSGSLSVSYDMGGDTQIPVVSIQGIILVSLVMACFLFMLLALAVYAWWTPTWTTTLDAFAMLRIGAAVGAPLRPRPSPECDIDDGVNEPQMLLLFPRHGAANVAVLDQMPGWVGDGCDEVGRGPVGLLALGGRAEIGRGGRLKYRSH